MTFEWGQQVKLIQTSTIVEVNQQSKETNPSLQRYHLNMSLILPNWDIGLFQNQRWGEILRLHPTESARLVTSAYAGLFEAAAGLSLMYNHKKQLAFISGGTPYLPPLMTHFERTGMIIQNLSWSDVEDGSVETKLAKDSLMVISSEDHMITGKLYPWQKLDEVLNQKKIFNLRVSHQAHLFYPHQEGTFGVRVCSMEPVGAWIRAGARFKPASLLSHTFAFNLAMFEKHFHFSYEQDQKAIESFIQQLPPQVSVIEANANCLFDRVLLRVPEFNTQLIAEILRSHLPQEVAFVQSMGFCDQRNRIDFKAWAPELDHPSEVLWIGVRAVKSKEFSSLFKKALDEARRQSHI